MQRELLVADRAELGWWTGTPYCWVVLSEPRLRQVALVAHDCGQVAEELRQAFGWPPPFHDPGVGQFGLTNAVFAVGDTFVEVVAPAQPDTTAGRYLRRRGGDGGYMAIFQVPDLAAARRRVAPAWEYGWSGPPTCPISPGPTFIPGTSPGPSCPWTGRLRSNRGGGQARRGQGRRPNIALAA